MAYNKLKKKIMKDWFQSIAEGNVSDYEVIEKFGENPDVDTGTDPEDVWDYGGVYTFSSTADIDQISSSDDTDTQDVIVCGLDEDWGVVEQTVTLTGQTPATLDTPLIRVYRMYNSGTTDFSGDIYLSTNGAALTAGVPNTANTVRAMIRNGNNQRLMCIYTIPSGKTGYFWAGYIGYGASSSTGASFTWSARLFGKVFCVKSKLSLIGTGTSTWNYTYKSPVKLPEKTDVKIVCKEVEANNTAVTGGFTVLLKDN
jgi:hypothetical protein